MYQIIIKKQFALVEKLLVGFVTLKIIFQIFIGIKFENGFIINSLKPKNLKRITAANYRAASQLKYTRLMCVQHGIHAKTYVQKNLYTFKYIYLG